MTEQRPATGQFSAVVDALQLGEKTGILTVEREEGGSLEVGTIMFVNGSAVDATLGAFQGREAATRLFSWQECRFSFTALSPEQIMAGQGICPVPAPAEARPEKSHPAREFHQGEPGGQDASKRWPFPTTEALEALDTVLLEMDRRGFTRMHRRLFLLIDGKRSIHELALLVGRTPDEIIPLLADLERAGFIQQ